MSEYFERMLKEDSREKKKTGSGVFKRAARLRAHEIVRTPSETLTGYEKRKITGPGIVHTTTIEGVKLMELLNRISEGEIPAREEFDALEFSSAQEAVAEVRRLHNNVELIKAWKCAPPTVSRFFEKYQVAKAKGNNVLIGQAAVDYLKKNRQTRGLSNNSPEKSNEEDNISIKAMEIALSNINPSESIAPVTVNNKPPVPPLITVSKVFNNIELQSFLERLTVFLSEPETKYYVEIRVTEV